MILKKRFAVLVTATAVLLGSPAFAYQFVPTDVEWQTWPGYCKAKYAWTNIGKSSKFAKLVNPAHRAELSQLERTGIHGVHHYCAGTIWIFRSRLETDPARREYMLRNARNETLFTLDRSNNTAPAFANVIIQMATITYEQGQPEEAILLLQSATINLPNSAVLYSATAVMQRRTGDLDSAKRTLIQGDESLNGQSAEINYNLGLILLELGELDEATKHAKLAYELGYPLPGLRMKLKKIGRM